MIRQHLASARHPSAREGLKWFYLAARAAEALAEIEELGGESGIRKSEMGRRENLEAKIGNLESGISVQGSRSAGAGKAGGTPALPGRRGAVPLAAAKDLGGADWERDLIAAVRARGFLWRTEETYRAWAGRFADFLRPRSPEGYDPGT